MNFRVSVIIPLYNSENTIISSIDSVINQTYVDRIEIIVINDGSVDDSLILVEEYVKNNTSNRFIKIINQINRGVSCARNIGIKESLGKYIAFLDSDDIWHPQKLELILETLMCNEINILGHGFTLIDNRCHQFSHQNLIRITFHRLLLKNFAVTPSIVIKKESCQFFDESLRYTEDHELWLRMSLNNDVYYVDLPLVMLGRKPLSNGGLSGNRWLMRKSEIRMYSKIIKHKKSLFFMFPFLIAFSLVKHLRGFFIRLSLPSL